MASGALAVAGDKLPARSEFPVTGQATCLNNARWHPQGRSARRAVEAFLDFKASGGLTDGMAVGARLQSDAKQKFAQLVNVEPGELSLVQSTTMGENLVVRALGLPQAGGNVVTDALHFQGSLWMYEELAKQGLEVRIAQPDKDWRITPAALDRLVDKQTRLVAVSQISMITGHEHDLRQISALAHAKGALVYADIIQAVGAMPVDLRAAGVDFAAAASFKWLMGDFGLGFLYTRKDHLGRTLQRPLHGYRQAHTEYHLLPHEGTGKRFVEFEPGQDAAAYFEVSSTASIVAAALGASLGYIQGLGVETIAAHRKPMLERLRREMPRLGFTCLTPEGARGPLIVFSKQNAAQTYGAKLQAAKVDVSVYPHRIRISPSVYNDMADIERFLGALTS